MAKNRVIRREEILGGETLSPAESALFWLQNNWSKLLSVVSVGAVIFAGFSYYNISKRNRDMAASDLFFYAETEFRRAASAGWATEERFAALEVGRSHIDELLEKYPDSPVARAAIFQKANSYFIAGDDVGQPNNTREALRLFTEYEARVAREGDRFEQAAAQVALGNTQENLWLLVGGSIEEARDALVAAISHYDSAIAIGAEAGFLRFEAMNSKARVLAFQGREADAIELYREVMRNQFRLEDVTDEEILSNARRYVLGLKSIAHSGTTYSTARIQLEQLGVDAEAFENELKTQAEAEAQERARARARRS